MIIIKSDKELDRMRVSASITAEIIQEALKLIVPGITTVEIDDYCESLVKKSGAKPAFKGYRGYPKSLCISINDEVVHGIPKKRKLLEGDIVSLDFGVLNDGFYGDMAVTVGVGEIPKDKAKLIEVTKRSLELGIEQVKVGNRLGDVSSAIEHCVVSNGFSVVKDYVGHGIGRQMHEEPQIPNYGSPNTGPLLKEGMVLAIEPMVNIGTYKVKTLADGWTVVTQDGSASAHFEHTVAVTKNGPEVLTCLKKI